MASTCWWVGVASWAVALSVTAYSQAPPKPVAMVDYNREIHAILADHCLVCHNQDKRSSGLSLGTHDDILAGGRTGAVVKPGNSADSLIIKRLKGEVQPRMPLGGDPLSDAEIATIRTWIDQGARATPTSAPAKTKWEAPIGLTAPAVPGVTWARWADPIDRFTATYLAKHGVAEQAVVGDAEFARRAYLDIWGLLPNPDQLHSFVGDKNPAKRRTLVLALLRDTQKYSENWISYWNDLLRNDEGVTYFSEVATRKSITPWLMNALETNKPYNQWINQLLNPTEPADPDGFLTGVNWRGTVSSSQTPAMQASQNTAQIFLGINFKCNSCHDSFISKWKLKDAYALAAYFSAEEKLQLYRCDVAQADQFATAKYMYPELNRSLPSGSIGDRRATIAEIFTSQSNGRMPRTLVNRIWAKLMGRGFVENVDDLDGEPWSPELLDWVASDFVSSGYDLKHLIATIISSRTYQLPAVPETSSSPKVYSFRGPELRRLSAEEFNDAIGSLTGDWHVGRPQPNGQGGRVSEAGRVTAVFSGSPVEAAGVNPAPAARGPVANVAVGKAVAAGGQGVPPPSIQGGVYVRDWRVAGSSLSHALGRPIRDQVFSTRDTQATAIQALELVNGETLTHWLWRGSRRMLGELPAEPKSLFSRQVGGSQGRGGAPVPFDIDVSKAAKLYLIVDDNLSTAPDKATPIWLDASFEGPNGKTLLSALTPEDALPLREGPSAIVPLGSTAPAASAVRVKFPSVLIYDIAGKGFTRFTGLPSLENVPLVQGETVAARFFIFDQKPSMDLLAPPDPETPLPPLPVVKTISEAIDRVYWYLLGRAPSPAERQIASDGLRDPSQPGRPSADGLADLMWAVLMSPEFQFIR
jgi:mono/diheme cytochrome c family protein